jgi:hypothetical protein
VGYLRVREIGGGHWEYATLPFCKHEKVTGKGKWAQGRAPLGLEPCALHFFLLPSTCLPPWLSVWCPLFPPIPSPPHPRVFPLVLHLPQGFACMWDVERRTSLLTAIGSGPKPPPLGSVNSSPPPLSIFDTLYMGRDVCVCKAAI